MGARVSVIFTKNSKTFHHLDQIRASHIPGTLAKGHFGEKDQISLKNKAVE